MQNFTLGRLTLKKRKTALFLFLKCLAVILSLSTASAQVSQEWLRRDDFGATSDIAYRVVTDDSGNVYVTGSGGALGNIDIITKKYTSAGQPVWTKIWNGPGNSNDAPNAMIIRGNTIYITGYTEYAPLIQSNRRKDFATLKYDLNGTLLWNAFYNFSPTANWEDISYAIDVDMQSNVFVTGSSKSAMPQIGYRDFATIKYNPNGIQQWVVRYNAPDAGGAPGTNDDIPVALQVDGSGNIYVTGKSVGANSGYDFVTLKYNTAGATLWEKRYSMPGNYADIPYAMKLDSAGNAYVTGASSAYAVDPALWYDFATIKYTPNGNEAWIRRFNSAAGPVPWDEPRDLAIDDTGNVYVTGFVPSTTTTGDDIYTIKYNTNGTLLWQSRWDSPFGYEDHPEKMKLDKAGNIYITGYSKSDGSTAGNDYITLKFNNSGQFLWNQRYNGPNRTIDNAYDLALDKNNNVYVTGQSYGNSDDYVTIKYIQSGTCTKPQATITANGPVTFCTGQSVQLKATSTQTPVTYQWQLNGADITGATLPIYNASLTGYYAMKVSNDCGSTVSDSILVTAVKLPKAVITPSGTVSMCEGGSTLLSANTGNNLAYQWIRNNVNIPGAVNAAYLATTAGKYRVTVINTRVPGCSKVSPATTIIIDCGKSSLKNNFAGFSVYPNPSSNEFNLQVSKGMVRDLVLYDLAGKKVLSINGIINTQKFGGSLQKGVYLAQLRDHHGEVMIFKLIKE